MAAANPGKKDENARLIHEHLWNLYRHNVLVLPTAESMFLQMRQEFLKLGYICTGSIAEGFSLCYDEFASSQKNALVPSQKDVDIMIPLLRIEDHERILEISPGFFKVATFDTDDNFLQKCSVHREDGKYLSPVKFMNAFKEMIEFETVLLPEYNDKNNVPEDVKKNTLKGAVKPALPLYAQSVSKHKQKELTSDLSTIPSLSEALQIRSDYYENWLSKHSQHTDPQLHHFQDLVPTISIQGWPKSADEWVTRERYWPSKGYIDIIVNSGYNLVCKTSSTGDTDLEWRISFSFAEVFLSERLTVKQKATFCLFKTIFKSGCHNMDQVSSYCLKTLFYWELEKIPSECWSDEEYSKRLLCLFDELLLYLNQKYLPHYFLPKLNLFEEITDFSVITQNVISIKETILKFNCQLLLSQMPKEEKKQIEREIINNPSNYEALIKVNGLSGTFECIFSPVLTAAKPLLDEFSFTILKLDLLKACVFLNLSMRNAIPECTTSIPTFTERICEIFPDENDEFQQLFQEFILRKYNKYKKEMEIYLFPKAMDEEDMKDSDKLIVDVQAIKFKVLKL